MDISFIKDNDRDACACFCILSFPGLEVSESFVFPGAMVSSVLDNSIQCFLHNTLQVLFSSTTMVSMTVPYLPGYLAFREAPLLSKVIMDALADREDLTPQVIFVGNEA